MVNEPVDVDENEEQEHEGPEGDEETDEATGEATGEGQADGTDSPAGGFLTSAAFNVGRAAGAAKRGIDAVGAAFGKLGGDKSLPPAFEGDPESGETVEPPPEGDAPPEQEIEQESTDDSDENDAPEDNKKKK